MPLGNQTEQRLRALFVQAGQPKPLLLLGAGASVRSGIPLSDQIVELAAKWAYCQSNGRHLDDPTVVRSDWLKWLHKHDWYKKELGASENYSLVIEKLLQPRQNRRDFFMKLITPQVPASKGYEHLLELLDQGSIDTVLTTNFDRVPVNLQVSKRRPHYLEVIRTPSDYPKFTTSPSHPQFIYLHGSVEHYTDCNLTQEVQRLDSRLVGLLTPVLRDHPLIVVGYRGAEPSIVQHLFGANVANPNNFPRGIYWCVLRGSVNGVHPLVQELGRRIGSNLQLVEIDGFDELLLQLSSTCSTSLPLRIAGKSVDQDEQQLPFDMQAIRGANSDDFDWIRVQSTLVKYCRRMEIAVPTSVTREWLKELMLKLDLLREVKGELSPTNGGYLLFAQSPRKCLAGAFCELHLNGDPPTRVDGNLWSQLETLDRTFGDLNQPFRLKGQVSEVVYPYPRLALKELFVNALVHRSYSGSEPLRIEVDRNFIRMTNPGGLVEVVFQRVNVKLQEQIELGTRGIKGYRNPVVADLFYAAGAMDKEGSGLPDVHNEVTKNGSKVFFGPVDERNERFRALIYRRPEEEDAATRTATPAVAKSTFFANFLEVIGIPETLWKARTKCASAMQVYENAGKGPLPAFAFRREDSIMTFADLDDRSVFAPSIDLGTIEEIIVDELVSSVEGRREFVEVVNRALYRHFEKKGLIVDKFKKRAYFPRTNEGPRTITYQASFRQATRTVTKPVVSKRTSQVLYWEHEAVSFSFEHFGREWVLQVLPSYVFTKDGEDTYLHYTRIGALATRKAARDFNMQVYNDLVFWAAMLSGEKDHFEIDLGSDRFISVRGLLSSCELELPPADPSEIAESMMQYRDPRLEQLESEILEAAELDLEAGTKGANAD